MDDNVKTKKNVFCYMGEKRCRWRSVIPERKLKLTEEKKC